jgi:ribonuclease HII
VAGVDEAGRGALAGPVVAACVIFEPPVNRYKLLGIMDSKMLSPLKRERIYHSILGNAKFVSVGFSSVEEIESLNIRQATLLAMRRAVESKPMPSLSDSAFLIAVDGKDRIPGLVFPQETIVAGDRLVLSIAAASIVAKVSRDRFMDELDKEFPAFHFRQHKGYGTLFHRQMIEKNGLSPFHRPHFCRNIEL